jgi:hypothetical protein
MRRKFATVLRTIAATLVAATAPAAPAGEATIRDPHYGDALFHFYQEHYFTSLTGLMVSQHFDRVRQHADEAEILRGGLFLSYGLHREATQIFTRLLDGQASPAVADRAWFYLAKISYQRGLLPQSEQAIGRIGERLPPALQEERVLLQAQLLMGRADYAAAAKVLAAATTPGSRFARFNLGVALIRSGETARGAALLDELGRSAAADEETRSLRDRANLALGFTSLQDGQPQQARGYLERVRLDGMQSNKALLGFGWAAAEQQQPKLALVPWMELAGRDAGDAAVLEAQLAVPHAFGELGALGQSLRRYEEALAVYGRESGRLDQSVASIRAGHLIDGLLAVDRGGEMGWFRRIDRLPEMPHAGHLAPVLAEHAFQEGFKNLLDLLFLERNLRRWKDNLDALRDMLGNRRDAFAERLPAVRARQATLDVGGLAARVDALAAELARIEAQDDASALADARERELAGRLARVQSAAEHASDSTDSAALRERVRRISGALAWQQAEQFPARLWQAKKAMREIDAQLPQARARAEALARAQIGEPANFDRFAARIGALDRRIDRLLPQATELARAQQVEVQELAAAVLLRQKERLAQYSSQARFAIARLYDQAHLATDNRDEVSR